MALIKLDFDKKELPMVRINYVFKLLRLRLRDVKIYKTRKGWHVKIEIKERIKSPITLTLIQALMGSDYRRETFNMIRAYNLDKKKGAIKEAWNVLYYKKLVKGKIVSEEKFDEKTTKMLRGLLCGKRK